MYLASDVQHGDGTGGRRAEVHEEPVGGITNVVRDGVGHVTLIRRPAIGIWNWTLIIPKLSRTLQRPGNLAIAFFVVACLLLIVCGIAASGLIAVSSLTAARGWTTLVAFAGSTTCLSAASVMLIRASANVRIEKQAEFRRAMLFAVAFGSAFVILQSWALWGLLSQRHVAEAIGLRNAAFAFVFLHGMHVIIALLFVLYVSLHALANRYDHEYSWGVTFCGWFWHGLGVVWLVILAAFLIAGSALIG